MQTKPPLSLPARIAIAALALLGLIGGWMIVITGGFHHGYRYSKETIFINGGLALVMAAIMFLMATVAFASLLQAERVKAGWYFVLGMATLGLPVLFLVLK